ncbi:MAG: hypothetical protein D6735_13605 [Acidobacteria bacterium]|nr:MAG: hypothetical protein D6735_13605 [Acidobacteriota bacterium]
MFFNTTFEIATSDGWKSTQEIQHNELVLGCGMRATKGGFYHLLWSKIYQTKETLYNGIAINYKIAKGLQLQSPPHTIFLVEMHPRENITSRTIEDITGKHNIYRIYCANPKAPEYPKYEILPEKIPIDDVIKKKTEYLKKGLFANYQNNSLSIDTQPRIHSWFALAQKDFIKILSNTYDTPFEHNRKQIVIVEPKRTSEYLDFLQILLAYYGYCSYIIKRKTITELHIKTRPWHIYQFFHHQKKNPITFERVEDILWQPITPVRFLLTRINGYTCLCGLEPTKTNTTI